MEKALFNKKYGLQSAVLEGRKEQTRRICRNQFTAEGKAL